MDPLHVAFDVGPLSGRRTGVGQAVAAMHEALTRRDEVSLRNYVVSFRAASEPDVSRVPIPALIAHRAWARTSHPLVDRFLGATQLIHGTNYVVPPSRLPRVVSVYDCWFLQHPDDAAPAVHRAGLVLSRAIRSGATAHVSSQATADALRMLFPAADIEVVPLAALPLSAAPSIAPIPELQGRPFIVAVGTLETRKNLPMLIRAFGDVAAAVPDVALVIAGAPGDDSAAINSAIDALGSPAAARVLLTGWIDEPVRSWLLRHAAVLAYPSLDEGFGFPLLDAMQARTPIVGSSSGSIPEVAGGAALLGAPDDSDLLAANLIRVLTDRELRDQLISAGDSRWREFSWDDCAAGLARLYRRLVAGSST